jgi:hypothetical protein
MTDADYSVNGARIHGVNAGQASSLLHNKLFYQLSVFVSAFAQAMASKGYDVTDASVTDLTTIFSKLSVTTIIQGSITHGSTIPLPSGYTQDQCKWFVTPGFMFDDVSTPDISWFQCTVDSNRKVTLLIEGKISSASYANYTILGVK